MMRDVPHSTVPFAFLQHLQFEIEVCCYTRKRIDSSTFSNIRVDSVDRSSCFPDTFDDSQVMYFG